MGAGVGLPCARRERDPCDDSDARLCWGGYGVEFVTAFRRGPWGGSRDRALHRGRPRVVGGLAEFRPDPSDVLAGDSTPGGADGARRGLWRPGIRNARPPAGEAGPAGAATFMDRNRLPGTPVARGPGRACIPLS